MAIKRMISRDGSMREFQADMITLGKIRTGIYATPAGKRGRPEKLDRFRFTSPDEALIRAVADEYGGEVRPWSPEKDPKRKEWEVITDTNELHVLIVNGQNIDPTYEAWAAGRTCVRRCDGEWDVISQAPCLCTGPDKPMNPQELCKITTRVKVMLQRIAGVGSWMYESHGENFATETGGLMAELVARAAVPVPSLLRLELETRRERNHEKGAFETKSFYVARFRTTAATPQQAITGGDVLTRALTGAPVREIASTTSATVFTPVVPVVPTPVAPFDIEGMRPRILADIEAQTTVEGLNAIRDKLVDRGVTDATVRGAWRSKINAVEAAARLRAEAERLAADPVDRAEVADIMAQMEELRPDVLADAVDALSPQDRERLRAAVAPPDGVASPDGCYTLPDDSCVSEGPCVHTPPRPYRVLVTASRTWDDVETLEAALDVEHAAHPGMVLVHGDCKTGGDHLADVWAQKRGVEVERHPADWEGQGKSAGFARNQAMVVTFPDRVFSFNRLASKGAEHCTAAAEAAGLDVVRYVDDTPVGGKAPDRIPVEGAVENVPGMTTLPDVPGDDHDAGELYTMLMTGASKQASPLTTAEVNALICRTFDDVDTAGQATGLQLARLRAGLKAGVVSWR